MGTLYKSPDRHVNEILEPLTDEQRDAAASYYRMVYAYANKMIKRECILKYDDFIEHGHQTLVKCVRNYDPSSGNKFSTYFYRAMNQQMAVVRRAKHKDSMRFAKMTDLGPRANRVHEMQTRANYLFSQLVVQEELDKSELDGTEIYKEALTVLDPSERDVLVRLVEHNLRQVDIAHEMGLSKQRIGQIYHRAIAKLRAHFHRTIGYAKE